MRVTSIYIRNFRAYEDSGVIALGAINVLVGPNNTGKSSVIKALHFLQNGANVGLRDIRTGSTESSIQYTLSDIDSSFGEINASGANLTTRIAKSAITFDFVTNVGEPKGVSFIGNQEPNHFIVPFLANRKVAGFSEDTRRQHVVNVRSDLHFLSAKIARLANPTYPAHRTFTKACKEILGYPVYTVQSENGQQIGFHADKNENITIEQMGDGVANILGLLADLSVSEGKLFLLEEPENDLHPSALKALLDLIVDSSKVNQFVISTHSNIVVTHLTSPEESKLYQVSRVPEAWPPKAMIREVRHSVAERTAVLRELGYSFADFDLWEGWLILEESSAERIIKDYLIPWFAPKLKRVRLVSSGGVSEVEPTTKEFNRLVRFTHLEDAYKGKVWVRVDGDAPGKKVVTDLRTFYSGWSEEQIQCFTEPQFENYYPSAFKEQITAALAENDRQTRRELKKKLLHDVVDWLEEDEARGRAALASSAASVIADLQVIEKAVS